MSHYSLAVITDYTPDYAALCKLLAPFEEDAAPEYMTEFFEDDSFKDGGFYINPNAKWDWWMSGGRWRDLISVGGVPTYQSRIGDIDEEFTTWAVLTKDGEWEEPGRVGFFGTSTATMEREREWNEEYGARYLGDPDLIVTIIDCHI